MATAAEMKWVDKMVPPKLPFCPLQEDLGDSWGLKTKHLKASRVERVTLSLLSMSFPLLSTPSFLALSRPKVMEVEVPRKNIDSSSKSTSRFCKSSFLATSLLKQEKQRKGIRLEVGNSGS
ncbi:hypothetical protein CEXT_189981 [Caerostris extrusa]|uniref:Uncharacterized protein n=1 Tax=Caerostris extrusa TaxID=172846 RepID=A0AAV4NCE2_CAEEX|nr:hypothetical protein CEXT_189981 [Caerostris extrusa]